MVDGLLKGHGAVLNQHMPKASWAYNEELDAYPDDPDKAKQLLEEAGYKDKDGDGFVEDPKGKPFSLKLDYPTGNPIREKTAPIIAEDLKKIGLKVEVAKPREFADADAVEKDKVEMWLMGWSLTPDPDLRHLAQYRSLELPALGQQGERQVDQRGRGKPRGDPGSEQAEGTHANGRRW